MIYFIKKVYLYIKYLKIKYIYITCTHNISVRRIQIFLWFVQFTMRIKYFVLVKMNDDKVDLSCSFITNDASDTNPLRLIKMIRCEQK